MLKHAEMRRDVQKIFKLTPHNKQVMMFSATLSEEIRPICRKFMHKVIIFPTAYLNIYNKLGLAVGLGDRQGNWTTTRLKIWSKCTLVQHDHSRNDNWTRSSRERFTFKHWSTLLSPYMKRADPQSIKLQFFIACGVAFVIFNSHFFFTIPFEHSLLVCKKKPWKHHRI